MTSEEKTKFIESRVGPGFYYTTRQVQTALKFKFGSGVKNEIIGAIRDRVLAIVKLKNETKGNKNKNKNTHAHYERQSY